MSDQSPYTPPRESGGAVKFRITKKQKERLASLQETYEVPRKRLIEILLQELAESRFG